MYVHTQKKSFSRTQRNTTFLPTPPPQVATDIIHLSQLQLESYHGNYETFEQTRMEKMKNQKKAVEAQDRQKQHVQKFIDRFRYNAKRASLVQSRIKMLSKMEVIPALIEDPTCSFSFPDPEGNLFVYSFSYPPFL